MFIVVDSSLSGCGFEWVKDESFTLFLQSWSSGWDRLGDPSELWLNFCSSLWEFTGDFEETFAENSEPQNEFDMIIGAIEDIVVDDRFQELQNRLLEQNYQHFEVRFKIKTRTNFLFLTLVWSISYATRNQCLILCDPFSILGHWRKQVDLYRTLPNVHNSHRNPHRDGAISGTDHRAAQSYLWPWSWTLHWTDTAGPKQQSIRQ